MLLSKASKIGLYALVEMAIDPEVRVSASSVSARFGVSEAHVAKVLQQLARARLLEAQRGAGGGYQLRRSPSEITMLDVVEQLEGDLAPDACGDCPFSLDDRDCPERAATCSVHGLLDELSSHVRYTLESVTIQTLARKGRRNDRQD